MSVFHRIRLYHAALAILVAAAYLTGDELDDLHIWLGYAVAAVILFRVLWAAIGPRQLGISRLFPDLTELAKVRRLNHPMISRTLLAGIVINLLLATGTGLLMEPSPIGQLAAEMSIAPAFADDDREREHDRDGKKNEVLEEVHETTANLLVLFVALHVAYLLAFKRPMALFMLFLREAGAPVAQKKA
ncbi:MAG: cytochrome b/b6 domain-containing protein [Parvibaculum sp.]|uniref:cytochrome b/b6 domain-containing protein n=1 Tax=Parvibaculum sp. TaxID=2024848 RepID=UPI002730DD01|nr:cytochrome b/b6 domain-containing protein [Parvibaculum sp.]MDP1627414.1 cytochrome b/b6 domain-containing protein [Parvibaculum sp.]MDP2148593.1 cytochrome b/b6 domain-containing protein [Parvibaculum sp.]